MKIEETRHLGCGLYRINWKSGGYSFASVGILHNGRRWFAPDNWTAMEADGIASTEWQRVLSVKLLRARKTNEGPF